MGSRDADVRAVVARLDTILAALRGNVEALNGILTSPAPGGGAEDERLVQP
jgi:hypothetical protein